MAHRQRAPDGGSRELAQDLLPVLERRCWRARTFPTQREIPLLIAGFITIATFTREGEPLDGIA